MSIAFVLAGGGHLGAYQVGMLRALLERGVRPDVVVGTSVGAINGAAISSDPSLDTARRLEEVWLNLDAEPIFARSLFTDAANLLKRRTHLQSLDPLRRLIERTLRPRTFEDLAVHFECVAACIERAAEQWFSSGPLIDAILASAALPGVLPPVEIAGEHYIDGGIVNSVPIERALELGATELYVLHVGRTDRPLAAPRNLIDVVTVAFEIARRHRFTRDIAQLPDGVTAHVLPTGEDDPGRFNDRSQLKFRDFAAVRRRIDGAYAATKTFLDEGR